MSAYPRLVRRNRNRNLTSRALPRTRSAMLSLLASGHRWYLQAREGDVFREVRAEGVRVLLGKGIGANEIR